MATWVEVRPMRTRAPLYKTFGTYGGCFPLMSTAWEGMEYILEINANVQRSDNNIPTAKHTYPNLRCRRNLLQRHPVEVLTVEVGHKNQPHMSQRNEHWELMIQATNKTVRPKLVMEVWPGRAINWEYGPSGKASRI